jgi:hypothetical protein
VGVRYLTSTLYDSVRLKSKHNICLFRPCPLSATGCLCRQFRQCRCCRPVSGRPSLRGLVGLLLARVESLGGGPAAHRKSAEAEDCDAYVVMLHRFFNYSCAIGRYFPSSKLGESSTGHFGPSAFPENYSRATVFVRLALTLPIDKNLGFSRPPVLSAARVRLHVWPGKPRCLPSGRNVRMLTLSGREKLPILSAGMARSGCLRADPTIEELTHAQTPHRLTPAAASPLLAFETLPESLASAAASVMRWPPILACPTRRTIP